MNLGRYREFYQCDYDVAGVYGTMVPTPTSSKSREIVPDLGVGDFVVKLNHRVLLDGMLEICGCPPAKFRAICSAIDKLDKEEWDTVRAEMVDEKGLDPAVADRIREFVVLVGEPMELHKRIVDGGRFASHAPSMKALHDMRTLFGYLEALGALQHTPTSRSHGLDCYTGVIYEVVVTGMRRLGRRGRSGHDRLVGMFSPSGQEVPCVGVSIRINIFALMEDRARAGGCGASRAGAGASIGGVLPQRMRIANEMWKRRIAAEFLYEDGNVKLTKQMNHALESHIPFMIIFGDDELKAGRSRSRTSPSARVEIDIDTAADEPAPRRPGVAPSSRSARTSTPLADAAAPETAGARAQAEMRRVTLHMHEAHVHTLRCAARRHRLDGVAHNGHVLAPPGHARCIPRGRCGRRSRHALPGEAPRGR